MNIYGSGLKIRAWREGLGLTKDDAALILGVTRQTIFNWENNKNPLSIETINRLDKISGSGPFILKKGDSPFLNDKIRDQAIRTTVALLTDEPFRKEFFGETN